MSSPEPRTLAPSLSGLHVPARPGEASSQVQGHRRASAAFGWLVGAWPQQEPSLLASSPPALWASPVSGFTQHRPGKVISSRCDGSANDDAWCRPVTLQSALPGLSLSPQPRPASPATSPASAQALHHGFLPATAPEDVVTAPGQCPLGGPGPGWTQLRFRRQTRKESRAAWGRAPLGHCWGHLRGATSTFLPAGNGCPEPSLEEPQH